MWYQKKLLKIALRKHMLRVDMRVYCGDPGTQLNPNDKISVIRSILMASIIKGLDVVGIIDHNSVDNGLMAQKIAAENHIDLWVLSGEEYQCADKFRIIVYMLQKPMPLNQTLEQACMYAHQNNGFVMVMNVSKRQSQHLNKLKGSPSAPDAIEIYNSSSGGYQDMQVDYPSFITSGAKSATEMENINSYTLINRKEFEGLGLLPEGAGSDYVPKYLQQSEEIAKENNPNNQNIQPQNAVGVK